MTQPKPTSDWKVDLVKYGNLRDSDLQVYIDGINFVVTHVPTGITVDADTRPTREENWELAQQALSQVVEHYEASWSNPNPGPRPEYP